MPAKRIGKCHICGDVGELSYEHVPPRSAFNDRPVWVIRGDAALHADLENLPRGEQQQRGAGEYTLCGRCNSRSGAWYGPAFASFTWQAAELLQASSGEPSLYYPFHLAPLRVLKQIICMFMSVNGAGFAETHPELVHFVLNRWRVGLPPKYRFFLYLNTGSRARFAGVTGKLNIGSHTVRVLTEISFPPCGYLLCLSGPPPDERLLEITDFSRFLYDDWRHVALRVPAFPVYTHFPGDYRDRDTVLQNSRA